MNVFRLLGTGQSAQTESLEVRSQVFKGDQQKYSKLRPLTPQTILLNPSATNAFWVHKPASS